MHMSDAQILFIKFEKYFSKINQLIQSCTILENGQTFFKLKYQKWKTKEQFVLFIFGKGGV